MTTAINEFTPNSPYRTIKQFIKENPAFTEGGVRWEIFNEKTNGLKESGAILRNGRKVLIHTTRYFQWLDSINGIKPESDTADTNAA